METNFQSKKAYHLDEIKVKSRLLEIQRQTGKRLTGREIARRLKITPVTVTRHIKAQRNNPSVQRRLAQLLGVTLEALVKEAA